MNCTCIGTDYDSEGWDFEPSETFPLAKKNWKCGECGRVIPVGEKYSCYSGKWNGKFIVDRTCMDCRSVTEHLFCGFTFGHIWQDLIDHLRDCGDNIPYSKISKTTPMARSKICDIIQGAWDR